MTTDCLPQLSRLYLTDGGLETDIIFRRGVELPCFSSIVLMRDAAGRRLLDDYIADYIAIARRAGTGLILETPTWRASVDWAAKLGVTAEALDLLNAEAVTYLLAIKAQSDVPILVSGCIGPRGDGYDPGQLMSADAAQVYHSRQVRSLAAAGADMISGLTINNVPEAVGLVRAAGDAGMPVVISFTVETDGRLPTGDGLGEAIDAVDAATGAAAAYFMINCAHPSHFAAVLAEGGAWTKRLRGIRANASRCSHAELDAMTSLDDGDPVELGREYRALRERHKQLTVLGGCCGTDARHVAAIAERCVEIAEPRAAIPQPS